MEFPDTKGSISPSEFNVELKQQSAAMSSSLPVHSAAFCSVSDVLDSTVDSHTVKEFNNLVPQKKGQNYANHSHWTTAQSSGQESNISQHVSLPNRDQSFPACGNLNQYDDRDLSSLLAQQMESMDSDVNDDPPRAINAQSSEEVVLPGAAKDDRVVKAPKLISTLTTKNSHGNRSCTVDTDTHPNSDKKQVEILGRWNIVGENEDTKFQNRPSLEEAEGNLKKSLQSAKSNQPHTGIYRTADIHHRHSPRKKGEVEAQVHCTSKQEIYTRSPQNSCSNPLKRSHHKSTTGLTSRRPRMTTPERKESKRRASEKYRLKKQTKGLTSNQANIFNTADFPPSSPLEISHLPKNVDTNRREKPRGFAAFVNIQDVNLSANVSIDTDIQHSPQQTQHSNNETNRKAARQKQAETIRRREEEKITRLKHQLAAYENALSPATVLENSSNRIDGAEVTRNEIDVSSSSSDEDEDEEARIQRRSRKQLTNIPTVLDIVKKHITPPSTPPRPTVSGKSIACKTTNTQIGCDHRTIDGTETVMNKYDSENEGSDDEGTTEDMSYHYFVQEKIIHPEDSRDHPMEVTYGPYFTRREANAVAGKGLFHGSKAASYFESKHETGMSSDDSGLQTWWFRTDVFQIKLSVVRKIQRNARLPRLTVVIPRCVYTAYQRVIQRFGDGTPDRFSQLVIKTCSILDLANKHAGRAWIAHRLRMLPDTPRTDQVDRLDIEKEIRLLIETLDEEGGYFRKKDTYSGRDGIQEEVEVWVAESQIEGPRN